MDIAQDIRDRIITAANALYDEGARAEFPTVAAVRARAGTDMNAASIVMREWRRAQTVQAAPVAVEVPDKVKVASAGALSALWSEAQALANESLLSAQAAWDAERAEAEALRGELSEAFEGVRRELDGAQARIAELTDQAVAAARVLEDTKAGKAAAEGRATIAEQRAEEIQRRADDLKAELGRVHDEGQAERVRQAEELARIRAELDQARSDLVGAKAAAEAERLQYVEQRRQLAQDADRVAERLATLEASRDQARSEAGQAREEAARLQGKVEAMTSQQAELMRAMVAGRDDVKSDVPGATPPGKKKGA